MDERLEATILFKKNATLLNMGGEITFFHGESQIQDACNYCRSFGLTYWTRIFGGRGYIFSNQKEA